MRKCVNDEALLSFLGGAFHDLAAMEQSTTNILESAIAAIAAQRKEIMNGKSESEA